MSDSVKPVAIIQARLGSRRLPKKVLSDLNGKPVLQWVVEATASVKLIGEVVVATTTQPEDEEIEAWCDSFGVACFRGETDDVLKRYLDCAESRAATHIVRVTADCPLIDPATIEKVLSVGLKGGADYFRLSGGFPDGVDVEGFTTSALRVAHDGAVLRSEREHVTPYFRKNPSMFDVLDIELFSGLSHIRLTVDYPQDLLFLRRLLDELYRQELRPSPANIAQLLVEVPELTGLNSHIERNDGYRRSLEEDKFGFFGA